MRIGAITSSHIRTGFVSVRYRVRHIVRYRVRYRVRRIDLISRDGCTGNQRIAIVKTNHAHSLSITSDLADVTRPNPLNFTTCRDHQDFVVIGNSERRDFGANESYFERHHELILDRAGNKVFRVRRESGSDLL